MKKLSMKKIGLIALGVIGVTMLAVEPAMAQGLNNVTKTVKDQMPGVAEVFSAVAYVIGVGFGIKAALKLKEHNESKGQIPLSQPITLGIVAAILLALPSFLSTSKESVFGTGSQGTTLSGDNIRQIR